MISSTVYIKEDPAKCICRGRGEYWIVGKSPHIFNMFSFYPDMPDLDEMLVPCQQHTTRGIFTIDDAIALSDLGISLPTIALPEE